MTSKASLTNKVISQAESYDGIRAGIVRLKDVLKSPSYQATPDGPGSTAQSDDEQIVNWPKEARTVLILGVESSRKTPSFRLVGTRRNLGQ